MQLYELLMFTSFAIELFNESNLYFGKVKEFGHGPKLS